MLKLSSTHTVNNLEKTNFGRAQHVQALINLMREEHKNLDTIENPFNNQTMRVAILASQIPATLNCTQKSQTF